MNSSTASQSFQFSGRQELLYKALTKKDPVMGDLYACALRALKEFGEPERLFLAAHAIREMTKDLPEVLDVPILTKHGRLGDRVNALKDAWIRALSSQSNQAGAWSGAIDLPLRRLLIKLGEFFKWQSESQPMMRDNAAALFRRMDPAGYALPEPLEQNRVQRWIGLHGYFNQTAHRRETTAKEFLTKVEELEILLLTGLSPQPSEDFSTIDDILREDREDA